MDLADVLADRITPTKARASDPLEKAPFAPVLSATAGLSRPGKSSKGEKTMCDYSLMHFPNRLATDGKVLMTHKFQNGSVGLASPEQVQAARAAAVPSQRGIRSLLRSWLCAIPKLQTVCAVCIPPVARLRLYGIPEDVQRAEGVSAREEVTAMQNQYRDAVRFLNGREVLLQKLGPGVGIQVLSVALVESPETLVASRSSRS
jgi:hypothetical protein